MNLDNAALIKHSSVTLVGQWNNTSMAASLQNKFLYVGVEQWRARRSRLGYRAAWLPASTAVTRSACSH